MRFAVQLILAMPTKDNLINCTRLSRYLWIFEGDTIALDGPVKVLAEGTTEVMGGMNSFDLLGNAINVFEVDFFKINYELKNFIDKPDPILELASDMQNTFNLLPRFDDGSLSLESSLDD